MEISYLQQSLIKVFMRGFLLPILLLMIFGGIFGVTEATDAQDLDLTEIIISLDVDQVPLKKALNEIEGQTDLSFAFSYSAINPDRKVSIKAYGKSVEEILRHLFKEEWVSWGLSGKTILLKKWYELNQEEKGHILSEQVEGQVMDAHSGETLPGVNVIVKGTTMGTSTDSEGFFELTVESLQDTLVFSFVGYKTEQVPLNGRTKMDVALQPQAISGEEMVVVGYGEQEKENLTGAVSQVKGDDLALRPSSDITNALQGQIPGLNIQIDSGDPTETPELNVRGFNSINGGAPLVLIDGIEGDITRVNPHDIENVTVLKDASSAAIYGARASFGVILITTKSGKEGEIEVTYTNNFSFTTPTTRTDYVTDPYVFGKTVDAAIYGYNGSSYTGYDELDWEAIKMVAAGEIEPFYEQQEDGTYKFFYNTNWYDYIYRKWQPSNYHDISISGGTEKLNGYLSGRVFKRQKIQDIQDGHKDRNSLRAKLNFKPANWLELSSNILFTLDKDKDYGGSRSGSFGDIWGSTAWRTLFPFNPNKINGEPIDIGLGNAGYGVGAAKEDGNTWRKWNTEELTNKISAKANPLKNWEFNFNFSSRFTNTARTFRYSEFVYLYNNRLDLETGGVNRLSEYRWKDNYNTMDIFTTYSQNIAAKHNLKLLVGYNQENFDRDRVAIHGEDLLVKDKANLNLGTEIRDMSGSARVWAIQGYFSRFNYDYDKKYLLEVNARYDGSSRFPEENRWGLFPSVSAGWQLDREEFWTPLENIISSMKLRASYGKLGNQTVGVNTFRRSMSVGQSSWLENGERLYYGRAPNPLPRQVTWEKTTTIDIGLDLGFLQDRLTATFDLYERQTEDMYLPGEPLPAVFGASEPRENYAGLRNRGFELSLNYNDNFDVLGSELTLNVKGSVSNFKGVITKYNNPEGLLSSFWEGQELGQIWGYHVDGQFQSDEEAAAYQASFDNPSESLGNVYHYIINRLQNDEWKGLRGGDIKYVDVNGDGRIDKGDNTLEDHGDLMPIGNAMPKFPFSFNINAAWRGFDISLVGMGIGKQNWYPTGNRFWGPYQRPYLSFIRKDLVNNAWTPENPKGTLPQIYRGYGALNANRSLYEVNDYYLKNIGYLRIKNMTIGYTLPRKFTQRLNISNFRIYISGENILTWRFGDLTKYMDPEQAGSAISYSNPGDANARANIRGYPIGKTYSMGIILKL